MRDQSLSREMLLRSFSGAVMLFGIVFLLLTGTFWPRILAVLGVAALPRGIERGGLLGGGLAAFELIGLAVLIETGTLWPGILLLIGVSVIAGAVVRSGRR